MEEFNNELMDSLNKEMQELSEMESKLRSSGAKGKIIKQKRFLLELIVLKMELAIELTPEDYNIISEYDS